MQCTLKRLDWKFGSTAVYASTRYCWKHVGQWKLLSRNSCLDSSMAVSETCYEARKTETPVMVWACLEEVLTCSTAVEALGSYVYSFKKFYTISASLGLMLINVGEC